MLHKRIEHSKPAKARITSQLSGKLEILIRDQHWINLGTDHFDLHGATLARESLNLIISFTIYDVFHALNLGLINPH